MNKVSKLIKRWNPLKAYIRHHPHTAPFRHFIENTTVPAQYSKLLNCLTVATEERIGSQTACVGIYIDAGSRYEADFENGIGHFFQHIVYRGTINRSKAVLQAEMNGSAIFKSFMTRDMICFYALCLSAYVPLVIDILSDCVFYNLLFEGDIECQKKVVYAEMLEEDKDVNALLDNFLHSAAFQGTPLAKTISGPSENLYNFKASTICGYMHKYFCPTRTVLASVGGVKHDQMVCLANCYLNNVEVGHAVDADVYRYTGSDIRYRDDSMPSANVMIAVEGPPFRAPDHIVMEVARYALGSWDRSQISGSYLASQLARRATSGGSICDAFNTFNITYKDTGLWGVQFISGKHEVDDMSILVQNEWMYLCNLITNAEVERAKRFYMSKLLSKMQSNESICHDLGRWALYNDYCPSLLEKLNAINGVTAEKVRQVCTRYFSNRCPTVAAVGCVEGLMDYSRQHSGMYWLRI